MLIKLKKDIVRRSVYKVNKVRQNYTVEEESKYFKKLTEEGITPWEISKELSVDFHWVQAHLNIFKFPESVQKALWTGNLSVTHIAALENVNAIGGIVTIYQAFWNDETGAIEGQVYQKWQGIINSHSVDEENTEKGDVNISVEYVEGESMCLNLDLEGICASTGSACTSSRPTPTRSSTSTGTAP